MTRALCIVLMVCIGLLSPGVAEAKKKKKHYTITNIEQSSKYAAIVVDADSGAVLYEHKPDSQRFPASLTKMMTLYELFKALEVGRYSLSDRLKISAHSANQPPSKLGLKAGSTITVEEAIKALVIVSANDVAVAVAENLSGSERDFAADMTAQAKAMGMTRTRFVNASGLPDSDQVSTARDLYILSLRLMADFPQYYAYFSLESFRWGGRTFNTHNRLIGRVAGVDGIKTGYTQASGFNLATSARREGRRLITVVLGGATSRQRDEHVRSITETQFAALGIGGGGGTAVALVGPRPKPTSTATYASADVAFAPQARPGADTTAANPGLATALAELTPNAAMGDTGENEALPRLNPLKTDETTLTGPPTIPVESNASSSVASLLVPSAQAAITPTNGPHWGIQIGAYVSAETATRKLTAARDAAPELLGHTSQAIVRVVIDNTTFYRARFGPLEEADADEACANLSRKGFRCFKLAAVNGDLAAD